MSPARELALSARAILPAGIACAVVAIGEGTLLPAEQAAMARAVPGRRAEFAAGRLALRQAMAAAGLAFSPDRPILPAADRRPDLPPDYSVSLTHAGGLCVAIAASAPGTALGIDIEPRSAHLPDDLGDAIRPYRLLRHDIPPLAAFCAKEALFKRQFPATRRLLDFTDIAVVLQGDGRFAGYMAGQGLMRGKWVESAGFLMAISVGGTRAPA